MSNKIIVTPNWIGKILGKLKSLTIIDNLLNIEFSNGDKKNIEVKDFWDKPILKEYFWGSRLCLNVRGVILTFSFLNGKNSKFLYDELSKTWFINNEKYIKKITNRFYDLTEREFLRDSNIDEVGGLVNKTKDFIDKYKDTVLSGMNMEDTNRINFVLNQYPISHEKVETLRKLYETLKLEERESFFDTVEKNPLTENQRLSVIRNNDINLVLAAAGTGKTSVMVAKVLDLIDSGCAKADEVLALAYNRDAAVEVKQRFDERKKSAGLAFKDVPRISTFHALGLQIIKDCGRNVTISKMATDEKLLIAWFKEWLKVYLLQNPDNLNEFIKLLYQPVDAFTFSNKEEYDSYIRDNEYRSINGEKVKGYQELLIANWFTMHNVQYRYEEKYVPKRRVEIGFDYRPDFYLGNGIYLEHFGINRDGTTRADIDDKEYNETILKKRALHEEYETTLLETYHYNWVENQLYERLESLMIEAGIELREIDGEELLECLNKSGLFEEASNRYSKCLQAIRTERLSRSDVKKRLEDAKIVYAEEYTKFLMSVHEAYISKLQSENEIDFDDMIILATDLVNSGEFKPKWKHILVDEFQDISMARLEFIQAIYNKGPRPIWTVVGDDWQSIYRFSGGKLEITTQFEKKIGSHTISILDKTYRYNNSIADTAGTFIMENPEQYEKNIETHTKVDSSCIYLYDTYVEDGEDILNRLNKSINKAKKKYNYVLEKSKSDSDEEFEITGTSLRAYKIAKAIKAKNPKAKIAILARYNYILNNVKEILKDEDILFWTFHGAKGLEADYCILLGFFRGKVGFPNENHDDAVLEALLPSLDDYPHSEERRLFYVALTRAKKESHIVVNSDEPSVFIEELLSSKYQVNIESSRLYAKNRSIYKCNHCTTGYYILHDGPYGKYYTCSAKVSCPSRPRVCDICGAPSIDYETKSICQNPKCGHTIEICDVCGRPMKIRKGLYGTFLGCTGYGVKGEHCTNTRALTK